MTASPSGLSKYAIKRRLRVLRSRAAFQLGVDEEYLDRMFAGWVSRTCGDPRFSPKTPSQVAAAQVAYLEGLLRGATRP